MNKLTDNQLVEKRPRPGNTGYRFIFTGNGKSKMQVFTSCSPIPTGIKLPTDSPGETPSGSSLVKMPFRAWSAVVRGQAGGIVLGDLVKGQGHEIWGLCSTGTVATDRPAGGPTGQYVNEKNQPSDYSQANTRLKK